MIPCGIDVKMSDGKHDATTSQEHFRFEENIFVVRYGVELVRIFHCYFKQPSSNAPVRVQLQKY